MRPPRRLFVLALLAWLGASVPPLAADDPWERYVKSVDPSDAEAVQQARRRVEQAIPGFWLVRREATRLRFAAARELAAQEIRALFEQASEDDERLDALLENLSSRDDLAALVLDRGLVPRLAQRLEGVRSSPAFDLALEAAWHGEPDLAWAFLRDPRTTLAMASELTDGVHAAGLATLADAVVGRTPLPAAARARLGDLRPDLENRYVVRPLGRERIAALSRVCATDADPALRTLAARLLHASLDPEAAPTLLSAYRNAGSVRIDAEEWRRLGGNFGDLVELDPFDGRERLAVLEGWIQLSHVRASNDPEGAESLARRVRALWDASPTATARADLVALLREWDHAFIDLGANRPVVAPAWTALVLEWERLAAVPSEPLAPLLRRATRAFRHAMNVRHVPMRPIPRVPGPLGDPDAALRDEGVALGCALDALERPSTTGIAFVTRIVTGQDGRPDLRAALADAEASGVVERADPWRLRDAGLAFPLDEGERRRLAVVLADAPNPGLVDLAAFRLTLAGKDADLDLLLTYAQRVTASQRGCDVRLPDFAASARGPRRLASLLQRAADPGTPREVAGALLDQLVEDVLDPDRVEAAALTTLLTWVDARAAELDTDVAEHLLTALLGAELPDDDPRAPPLDHVVRQTVSRLRVEGVRLRLEARLARR